MCYFCFKGCDATWIKHGNKCYKTIIESENSDQNNATEICSDFPAKLVTIDSEDVEGFLTENFNIENGFYIGARKVLKMFIDFIFVRIL